MIEKYIFEIKDYNTYNHVEIKIIEVNEDCATDRLKNIISNAKEVFITLYPAKRNIELDIRIRLIKKDRVINQPNHAQYIDVLIGNGKKIYPYIVFNVNNNLCYHSSTVSYDCELRLNRYYMVDDEQLNYEGITNQKFKDYMLLKELFEPYRGVLYEQIHV